MYFVFRVRTAFDGSMTKAVYDFVSEASAMKSYFSTLASDTDSTTVKRCMCMVIDENGDVVDGLKRVIENNIAEP